MTRANNSHWHRLLKVIGHDDLIDDERYDSPAKRNAAKDDVHAMVTEWSSARTKREAMMQMGGAGVPCGAVYDTMELHENPDFEKRGIFQTIDHPTRGAFKMAAWPVKMSGTNVPVAPSPLLGEHNASVYAEWIGLSAEEVASLKADGAV